MTIARIILSESSGRWAFALRSVLVNSGVAVTEIAGLENAFGRFRDDSQALLAFEATEACAEEGLQHIYASRLRDPGSGVIVLLDASTISSESVWHEAGAIAVAASPRHLTPIARLIHRYFVTRDIPPLTFREAVWQRIPWNASELQP